MRACERVKRRLICLDVDRGHPHNGGLAQAVFAQNCRYRLLNCLCAHVAPASDSERQHAGDEVQGLLEGERLVVE